MALKTDWKDWDEATQTGDLVRASHMNAIGEQVNQNTDDIAEKPDVLFCSQSDYDALSSAQKNNGTIFMIEGGGIAYKSAYYARGLYTTEIKAGCKVQLYFAGTTTSNRIFGFIFVRGILGQANLSLCFNSYGYNSNRFQTGELTKGSAISYDIEDETQAINIYNNSSNSCLLGLFLLYGNFPTITQEAIE